MKKFIVRITEDSKENGWDILSDQEFRLFRDAKAFALEQEQKLQKDWRLISRYEKAFNFKSVFSKNGEIRTIGIIKK
jgi:hypothetical protein|nr:MAG TPA: hypothetical protein [Caudoviricetes sp.]